MYSLHRNVLKPSLLLSFALFRRPNLLIGLGPILPYRLFTFFTFSVSLFLLLRCFKSPFSDLDILQYGRNEYDGHCNLSHDYDHQYGLRDVHGHGQPHGGYA